MSPEQFEGKGVDHRSDLFSLGVVLYLMLTGEHPHPGDTTASIMYAVLMQTPPFPKELRPQLPDRLCALVMKLLAKSQDDRPQSASEVIAELKEIGKGAKLPTAVQSKPEMPKVEVPKGESTQAVPDWIEPQVQKPNRVNRQATRDTSLPQAEAKSKTIGNREESVVPSKAVRSEAPKPKKTTSFNRNWLWVLLPLMGAIFITIVLLARPGSTGSTSSPGEPKSSLVQNNPEPTANNPRVGSGTPSQEAIVKQETKKQEEEKKQEEKKQEAKKQEPPKQEAKKQEVKNEEPKNEHTPKLEPKKQEVKNEEPKNQDTPKLEPNKNEGSKIVTKTKPKILDCTGKAGADVKTVQVSQRAWAEYLGVPVETSIDLGVGVKLEVVLIPPGRYWMGAPKEEQDSEEDERPFHMMTITKAFYLGKYEVTQEEYKALMNAEPSWFKKDKRNPVENVSWEDAQGFCQRLAERSLPKGFRQVRLPSEAEWEYACRAGRQTAFHFGNRLNGQEANCNGKYPYGTTTKGPYLGETCRVGSYKANAFGLYDMHGNVWEWCEDFYDAKAYESGVKEDRIIKQSNNNLRVLRGGSWYSDSWDCRSASRRKGNALNRRYNGSGFRICFPLD